MAGLTTAALVLLSSAANEAGAQLRAPSYDWTELRGVTTRARPAAPVPRDRGISGGATYGAAVLGGAVGWGGIFIGGLPGALIGSAACSVARDRRGDDGYRRTGECLENDGIVYGAMLGSLAASSAAVRVFAEREGCDFNDARRRSLRGALLGTLPSVAWLVAKPELIGPGRIRLDMSGDLKTLVAVTPLVQAVGAALDVRRCTLKERNRDASR